MSETRQKPLRILTITPTYFPLEGGAERHLMFMSKVQVAAGKKVTILTQREPGTPKLEIDSGVEILRTTRLGRRSSTSWLCHLTGMITMLFKAISIAKRFEIIQDAGLVLHGFLSCVTQD